MGSSVSVSHGRPVELAEVTCPPLWPLVKQRGPRPPREAGPQGPVLAGGLEGALRKYVVMYSLGRSKREALPPRTRARTLPAGGAA
eukprot:6204515-Heterocapsa_arctica.AAC.1